MKIYMIEEQVKAPAAKKTKLDPFPNGWYVLEFSEQLKKGDIKPVTFVGQELVLYRTESGKAAVSDAFCPHLGAHFAHGGEILGEEIQCPFHGFRFDCEGTCTATGYGTKPPPTAKLKQWHVDERNGLIAVFHHAEGIEPDWFLPNMDLEGWTDYRTVTYELNSHPQETTENIADIGHFEWIHGYDNVREESKTEIDGPVIRVKYGFDRNGKELGRSGIIRISAQATAYGLGYSFVDTNLEALGLTLKSFVLPTPTVEGKLKLQLALAIKPIESSRKVHPLAILIPKSLLTKLVLWGAFKGYTKDVRDDFDIWNNKTYIMRPPLAKGDGPIALYRKWARQF
ncbi:MAG: Rieske 2Fe-2S domain-containing protein, partial [Flavobacteriales bacterium]